MKHPEEKAETHRHGGKQWRVTFGAYPNHPQTVEAATLEEAVTKAAEALGIISSEAPPEVVAL